MKSCSNVTVAYGNLRVQVDQIPYPIVIVDPFSDPPFLISWESAHLLSSTLITCLPLLHSLLRSEKMGLLITQCIFCFCTHSALDGSPSEGCSLNMTNSSPSSFLVLKYLPFIRIHPVFVSRYFKTPIMRFAIPSSRRCPIHSNLMKFLKIR